MTSLFVAACEASDKYTRPVVGSWRDVNGNTGAGMATFIALNSDGWVATAGHVLNTYRKQKTDHPLVQVYEQEVAAINASNDSSGVKRGKIGRLKKDPTWLTHCSMWWSQDPAQITEAYQYPEIDFALCRLDNFDLSGITEVPKFKKPDPNGALAGTSLVKIGYPFQEVTSTFDSTTGTFKIAPGSLERIPVDGILTRVQEAGASPEGFPIRWTWTSSPGLLGQSGGPTLDKTGAVWAIQSSTIHIPLGFAPKVKVKGKDVLEHQFLNVGIGVYVETLKAVFDHHGIAVDWV